MDQGYQKQGYLLEDFRLFHLRSAQGVKTEYHYHEFCKLLMLVTGSGGYWIDGQHYHLQAGDMVLLGSGCIHRPDFSPGQIYERIIVYIRPEFLSRMSTADCDLAESFRDRSGQVLRSRQTPTALLDLAKELQQELSGQDYGWELLSRSLLLRLLVLLGRELQGGSVLLPGTVTPKDARTQQIMDYIDTHLSEDLSAGQIAEHFYLSKFHMMRLFRSGTGSSLLDYITRRRLLLARDLIRQGHSATESCFRAGFGSYSSFTRSYARFFGSTPTGRPCTAKQLEESYE